MTTRVTKKSNYVHIFIQNGEKNNFRSNKMLRLEDFILKTNKKIKVSNLEVMPMI